MPIQIVASTRLYRQIADQLSALIERGEFLPNERLPAERELARQLGVSRPSVREALICLEIEGKVEVRVGTGVFVAQRKGRVVAAADGEGPFELLRARKLVEGEIAAVAARTATDAELVQIGKTLSAMQHAHRQNRNGEVADRAFHVQIAEATRNSALTSVVRDLWDRGRGAMWKRMEEHFVHPALRDASLGDHRAVYAALQARDARGARAAMRRHLERVDREYARGWELLKEKNKSGAPARHSSAPPQRASQVARERARSR